MIDHITFAVRDYEKSKAFYVNVLATLGYELVMEPRPKMGGFGKNGKPEFWIGEGRPTYWSGGHGVSQSPIHVGFIAENRAAVDAFHRAALAAGGKDFGGPGERPIYHLGYYGAFVLDLDGNNVEAVIHRPE
jgi:catechol 2,3-dioxygenase-like lactoylglutathione lyase family enzyme